jgi:hypothetical protein
MSLVTRIREALNGVPVALDENAPCENFAQCGRIVPGNRGVRESRLVFCSRGCIDSYEADLLHGAW